MPHHCVFAVAVSLFFQDARAKQAEYVFQAESKKEAVIAKLASAGDVALVMSTPRTLAEAAARREREKKARLAADLELQVVLHVFIRGLLVSLSVSSFVS